MHICIAQPKLNKASETFIAAHAARLPADVTVIHRSALNYDALSIGDQPVLSQSFFHRTGREIWRRVHGREWSWESTAAYLAAIRRTGAKAVLAEYGPIGVEVQDACRLAGVPLIVHFHGADASVHSILEKCKIGYVALFKQAAAIVAVSHAMQQKLEALGAPSNKLHHNPYGIDCNQFGGADPEKSNPTFVTVGRFVEKKAPQLTLLAFAEALRKRPEIHLRMIGDGPLLGACRDLAGGLGIADSVTFLAAQPPDIVQQELSAARAFVQHSVEASDGDCEGTPVAILEAGGTGLPVVATRHAGIPDAVVDGKTGLLVDERDVSGMAAHIIKLAQDPLYAGTLGKAARERIESYYSMDRSIDRLWEIIESCVDGHRSNK